MTRISRFEEHLKLNELGEVAILAGSMGFHRVKRSHAAVLLHANSRRSPEVLSWCLKQETSIKGFARIYKHHRKPIL